AVAEVRGAARSARADRDGRSDGGFGLEGPDRAAAGRIERVDEAALAADEETSADGGRLGARRRGVRKTERPFQCELRNLRGRQSRLRRRLKARVRRVDAPAVPARAGREIQRGRR